MARLKKLLKVIWQLICDTCIYIIKHINIILNFYYCFLCNIIIFSNKTNNMQKSLTFTFGYIIMLLCIYLANKTFEEENQLPKLNKRFTNKSQDGSIYIKKSDWQEAILYLSMVEDYIHGN